MHSFPIGQLLSKPVGYIDRYSQLKLPGKFENAPELESKGEVTFDLEIIKLTHEFTVHISNLKYVVPAVCSRCSEVFDFPITIESIERQYIYDLPQENIQPDEEYEQINRHSMAIDILPFIREELLLHFPSFPVCSDGCKGLCASCGANLNKKKCSCSQEISTNPFKALRGL